MACFKTSGDPFYKSLCIIQQMDEVTQGQAEAQLNAFLCPLFIITNVLRFFVSTEVSHSVSLVHQCDRLVGFHIKPSSPQLNVNQSVRIRVFTIMIGQINALHIMCIARKTHCDLDVLASCINGICIHFIVKCFLQVY